MTPDTFAYMLAGYIVAFLVMGLYVLSLYLRWRNLQKEYTLLADLESEQK